MPDAKTIVNTGLRGVTVADTKISDVRGQEGKLIYRGYLIEDLAKNATFEEVAYLLLFEKLPSASELSNFRLALAKEASLPEGIIAALKHCPPKALPMDVLQAGVALLAQHDPDIRDQSHEATMRMAVRLIALMPTLLAAWGRIRQGMEPLAPKKENSLAENFLYMLSGTQSAPEIGRFFDICLILHAEHSFNASTFAAREVASTRAHIYAACSSAIGALSGELHGGANVRVMEMLQKIGSVERVEEYVRAEFEAGRRIMGLGHAIYSTDDPRALILAPMSKEMGKRSGEPKWYEISRELETVGRRVFQEAKGREIHVNVDFYSASLYYAMGIPTDFFSPVFAISRIAGWTAHVIEEQFAGAAPKPMLYRPKSDYIGDYCGPDTCAFVPIDKRS